MIDIDLERDLAPLLDRAPEPPPMTRIRNRLRQRRARRRGLAGSAVGAVAILGGVAAVLVAKHDTSPTVSTEHPVRLPPASVPLIPATDTVRVTTPSGRTFSISGAPALGLSKLAVRFNAQISSSALVADFTTQRIVVQDVSVPTPRTCWSGTTYGHWRMLLSCGSDSELQTVYRLLDPKLNADGFLVFNPQGSMVLGPTDAPDIELGDDAIGVFGPETYLSACPIDPTSRRHTEAGLPALVDQTGAWWCDPVQEVRIHVADQSLVNAALNSLTVTAAPTVVTSLYGGRFLVRAPGIVLGRPRFQAVLSANNESFAGGSVAVVASQERPPTRAPGAASFPTGDGHELYAAKSGLGQDELAGTWGEWTVTVTDEGLSASEKAVLASSIRFVPFGRFLILRPLAPLELQAPPGPEVIFDGVWINRTTDVGCPPASTATEHTLSGLPVFRLGGHAIWCDPASKLRFEVQPPAIDAALKGLRVTFSPMIDGP